MPHQSDRLLILGYGNPSRGDDGLAHQLLDQLEQARQSGDLPNNFDLLREFQLQVENSLDLSTYYRVLLIDASANQNTPCKLTRVRAQRDRSYTSHALSPSALLHAMEATSEPPYPQLYLLAISGKTFELGDGLSKAAEQHLQAALTLCHNLIRRQTPAYWEQCIKTSAVYLENCNP